MDEYDNPLFHSNAPDVSEPYLHQSTAGHMSFVHSQWLSGNGQ